MLNVAHTQALQSWSRDLTDIKSLCRTTIQKQFAQADKWLQHNTYNANEMNPSHMPNAMGGGQGQVNRNHDYYLIDLAEGISPAKFPQGKGALALTHALVHAMNHGHDQIKLSQVRAYVRQHQLFDLGKQHDASVEDEAALARSKPHFEEYHNRVFPGQRRR